MRYRHALPLVLTAAAIACGGDPGTTAPTPPVDPPPVALLKDVVIPHLPSPYYHFEYDASGRVRSASFASGLTNYDVIFDGGRLSELRNNILVNHDRLLYVYDDAGRVALVKYVKPDGVVFTIVELTYEGRKLTGVQRSRRVESGFVVDKTTSFSYYPDGNLRELRKHYPRIEGRQEEASTTDSFEAYDGGINVEAFGLLHDEFFDHLVLLPDVQLQKGNPGRVTHTGDGDNYVVAYTYVYDDAHRPLARNGQLTFLTGPHAGERFEDSGVFSYY